MAAKRGAEPAKLNRLVRGDLDWIVMKALEKDRTPALRDGQRLGAVMSARHQSNEPVLASPPSLPYLVAKFVRRHKAGLATAAASCCVGCGRSRQHMASGASEAGGARRPGRRSQSDGRKRPKVSRWRSPSNKCSARSPQSTSCESGRPRPSRSPMIPGCARTSIARGESHERLAGQPALAAELQRGIAQVYFAFGTSQSRAVDRHRLATLRALRGDGDEDVSGRWITSRRRFGPEQAGRVDPSAARFAGRASQMLGPDRPELIGPLHDPGGCSSSAIIVRGRIVSRPGLALGKASRASQGRWSARLFGVAGMLVSQAGQAGGGGGGVPRRIQDARKLTAP